MRPPSARARFAAHRHIAAGRFPHAVAGWLSDDWICDWQRFRVPPNDLATVNPMQFVALTAAAEALAEVRSLPRATTAIILGASGLGYTRDNGLRIHQAELLEALDEQPIVRALDDDRRAAVREAASRRFDAELAPPSSDLMIGSLASIAAARIAAELDLFGPHYAVDADHASALAALDVAVRGLVDGEWDCVVTGGVSELLTPLELAAHHARGALAAAGGAPSFGGEVLFGEGAAILVLKRLADARRDGDRVYALVAGSGRAAGDGGAAPLATAMRHALEAAAVEPSAVGHLECEAADDGERAALAQVYGAGARLGSATPLLGHLRAAAGAIGLLRAALAVHHRTLPPTIGDLAATPWTETVRRAGVSAQALNGDAYHALLASDAPRRLAVAPRREEPIAIIALGGHYAHAADAATLWDNVRHRRSAVRPVPAARFSLDRYHADDRSRGDRSYARLGSFVDRLPAGPPELDVAHLLAADVARQAIADAGGAARWSADRVGVVLGYMPHHARKFAADARVNVDDLGDTLLDALRAAGIAAADAVAAVEQAIARFGAGRPAVTATSAAGWLAGFASARIAVEHGFSGPRLAIESACASTLAAVQVAGQLLRHGECDVVLAGGAFGELSPEFYVGCCRFRGLSPDGISPFGSGASGFVPGEGGGLFVLKRLRDAERDGDRIRAVLRGVGGSSDGRGRSLLAPTVQGEALAIRRALAQAGLGPDEIDYVECHGTATVVGDGVEVQALAEVFGAARAQPLAIASVKSNLGHLCAAAGAPALTNVVLALEHGELPRLAHEDVASTAIDFAAASAQLVRGAVPWLPSPTRLRRAGVSTFGLGGTNFHVVVEEYRSSAAAEPAKPTAASPARLRAPSVVAFAGGPPAALLAAVQTAATRLAAATAAELVAAAEELAAGATQGASDRSCWRLALTAVDGPELVRKVERLARAMAAGQPLELLRSNGIFLGRPSTGRLALLFPGQGPQYPGMLKQVADAEPLVASLLARADEVWRSLTGRALTAALWPSTEPAHEDLHAATFAVSCAVTTLLAGHGICADVLIGQSAGELAALVAAGALSFDDGLRAIHARTRAVLDLELADPGCMAALACAPATLESLADGIDGMVRVAAFNCDRSTLATGATAAMEELARRAAAANVEYTRIVTSHAYHSPLIAPAGPAYGAALARLAWREPQHRIMSTVDLQVYDADSRRSIDRLVRQYETPVQFAGAIERAWADGARMFFEVGPKWPLTAYVHALLDGRQYTAHAAIHPKVGELEQLRRMIACAFVEGVGQLRCDAERAALGATVKQTVMNQGVVVSNAEDKVTTALVAAMAARTGYPPEMLELDLDLEGDLGIDSVKQVEVIAKVRAELGLAAGQGVKLRDYNTLRKVIAHLTERLAASMAATTTRVESAATTMAVTSAAASPLRFAASSASAPFAITAAPSIVGPAAVAPPAVTLAAVPNPTATPVVRAPIVLTPRAPLSPMEVALTAAAVDLSSLTSERGQTSAPPPVPPAAPAPLPAAADAMPGTGGSLNASWAILDSGRATAAWSGLAARPAAAWQALIRTAHLVAPAPVRAARDVYAVETPPDGAVASAELHDDRVVVALSDRGETQLPIVRATFQLGEPRELTLPPQVLAAFTRASDERRPGLLVPTVDQSLLVDEVEGGAAWVRARSFCELVGGLQREDDRRQTAAASLPLLFEVAFTMVGLGWRALGGPRGTVVAIEELELGRAAVEGELLAHLRIRRATPQQVVADVHLVAPDGAVIARLQGVELVRAVAASSEPRFATARLGGR